MDAFCSPVNISVTSQDIIALVDAGNGVVDVLISNGNVRSIQSTDTSDKMQKDFISINALPRVSVLAPLCVLHFNFILDDLNLALLSESPNNSNSVIVETVKGFISIIKKRGTISHVVSCTKELTMKRLQKLGIPLSSTENVLSLILKSYASGLSEEESTEKALVFLNQYLSTINSPHSQFSPHTLHSQFPPHTPHTPHTPRNINLKSPLFELSLKGIKVHHYRLTYDNKSTVHIKDLLLSDHARFPVFHVEFKKKESKLTDNSNNLPTGSKGLQKRGNFKNPNKRASVRFPTSGTSSTNFSFLFFLQFSFTVLITFPYFTLLLALYLFMLSL